MFQGWITIVMGMGVFAGGVAFVYFALPAYWNGPFDARKFVDNVLMSIIMYFLLDIGSAVFCFTFWFVISGGIPWILDDGTRRPK